MTTSDANAPQASPTIQELLDEIFNEHTVALTSFTDDHGDTITDMDRVVIDVPKSKQAILTLFSRIITEARPEKKTLETDTDGDADVFEDLQKFCLECGQYEFEGKLYCSCTGYNKALDDFERNLRAAIEGKQ